MNTKHAWQAGFGKAVPETKTTWSQWGNHAHNERCVMTSEFHNWVVQKRIRVEEVILSRDRHLSSIEPFARAGLDDAETPADCPLVVLEFAATALDLLEAKREMALLDFYYKKNGNWGGMQEYLQVNPGDEAEIAKLWEMFLEDREAKAKREADKPATPAAPTE